MDKREIEAVARAFGYRPTPPGEWARALLMAEGAIAALDRVRDARGDDGFCETCAPLDDPVAMARATEALQVSADMPHSERVHYVVGAALSEFSRSSTDRPEARQRFWCPDCGASEIHHEWCDAFPRQPVVAGNRQPPATRSPQGEDRDARGDDEAQYHDEHLGEGREFDERCGFCRPELARSPQGEDHEAERCRCGIVGPCSCVNIGQWSQGEDPAAGFEGQVRYEVTCRDCDDLDTYGYGAEYLALGREHATALGHCVWCKASGNLSRVAPSRVGSVAVEDVERLQAAVDKAYGAMNSSAYVGGPSEREAWQTALTALGEVVTQHTGQADPDPSRSSTVRPEQPEPDVLGGQPPAEPGKPENG
jgi:hypothetical protein